MNSVYVLLYDRKFAEVVSNIDEVNERINHTNEVTDRNIRVEVIYVSGENVEWINEQDFMRVS